MPEWVREPAARGRPDLGGCELWAKRDGDHIAPGDTVNHMGVRRTVMTVRRDGDTSIVAVLDNGEAVPADHGHLWHVWIAR